MGRLIPPLAVIIRQVRPFAKYTMILLWLYIRILVPGDNQISSASRYQDAQHTQYNNCSSFLEESFRDHGFLQYIFISLIKMESFILLQIRRRHYDSLFTILRIVLRIISDWLGILFLQFLLSTWNGFHHSSFQELREEFTQYLFDIAKENISSVKRELIKEEMKMETFLSESLKDKTWNITRTLPQMGRDKEDILTVRTFHQSSRNYLIF